MIVLMLSMGSLFADTYTEDFDTDSYWSGGTTGSYNAKTYTNPDAPGGLVFSSNNAIRGTSALDELYSSPYSWRINKVANAYFLVEFSGTINAFNVYMAKWSASPSVILEYSVNGGADYTEIKTFGATDYAGSKEYFNYSYTFAEPIAPTPGSTIQIRFNTTAGERMLYDDFTIDYGEGGPTPIELAADFSEIGRASCRERV